MCLLCHIKCHPTDLVNLMQHFYCAGEPDSSYPPAYGGEIAFIVLPLQAALPVLRCTGSWLILWVRADLPAWLAVAFRLCMQCADASFKGVILHFTC